MNDEELKFSCMKLNITKSEDTHWRDKIEECVRELVRREIARSSPPASTLPVAEKARVRRFKDAAGKWDYVLCTDNDGHGWKEGYRALVTAWRDYPSNLVDQYVKEGAWIELFDTPGNIILKLQEGNGGHDVISFDNDTCHIYLLNEYRGHNTERVKDLREFFASALREARRDMREKCCELVWSLWNNRNGSETLDAIRKLD